MFVIELMRLPQDLEQKFEKEIISPNYYKEKKMVKYSKSSYTIVNMAVRDLYGATVEEIKAEAKETKAEIKEAKAEVKEAKAEAEATLLKSITLLHDNAGFSAEQIAEHFQLDIAKVKKILRKSKK